MTNPTQAAVQQPGAETLELINAEITASLARQSESGSRIDAKAIVLVGYAGAASSFLATRPAQLALAALAYAAYAATAGFGIWSYAVRSYEDVPAPRTLFNGYLYRDRADVLASLAASRVPAFERNAAKHLRKARLWLISLLSLVIGLVLMLLAVNVTAHNVHHDDAGRSSRTAAAARR